jgi:NADP-dependent 3-hydroxy-3-methylglutaryl-CoA reductase
MVRHLRQRKQNSSSNDSVPGKGSYIEDARIARVRFLETHVGHKLEQIGRVLLPSEDLRGNIENYIGSVPMPVGLAGPLRIRTSDGERMTYAPMATTEGALVASTCRGARVISESGGVFCKVLRTNLNRIPMFCFDRIEDCLWFVDWIDRHRDQIAIEIGKVSRNASLTELRSEIQCASVHVHFHFSTGSAAGQNMTTASTWAACMWILRHARGTGAPTVREFYIDGGMSGDKKVTYQSFLNGRGRAVIAEAALSPEIILKYLHISAEALHSGFTKALSSGVRSGMLGFNINAANVVAAIFMATGQDAGCIHESGIAQLDMQLRDGVLHASIMMPSLIVGSVGGGTSLPSQREMLSIMHLGLENPADRVAELIAAYALALDLSTLAAIVSGEFVQSHERLGRNRPQTPLNDEQLNAEFVLANLDLNFARNGTEIRHDAEFDQNVDSILTQLGSFSAKKFVGFKGFRLFSRDGSRQNGSPIIVKSKATDLEVGAMVGQLAGLLDRRLASIVEQHEEALDSSLGHLREIEVYRFLTEHVRSITPLIFGSLSSAKRDAYLLILERVEPLSRVDIHGSLKRIIDSIGRLHAFFYEKTKFLEEQLRTVFDPHERYLKHSDLFVELNLVIYAAVGIQLDASRGTILKALTGSCKSWMLQHSRFPKTLIHNDLTLRNVGTTSDGSIRIYDWELACINIPQRDLVELLAFTCSIEEIEAGLADTFSQYHKTVIEQHLGNALDRNLWNEGMLFATREFLVCRLPYYALASSFRQDLPVQKIMDAAFALLKHFEGQCHVSNVSGF